MISNFFGGKLMRQRQRHRRGANLPDSVTASGTSLNDRRPGATCRIRRLHGHGAIRQRFLDMGFIPETEVTVIRSAPLKDPIEVRIGDSFITLRRAEAAQIEVVDV